jgi:hypothetical protein
MMDFNEGDHFRLQRKLFQMNGLLTALQGKKRRTLREEPPYFEGKAPYFEGRTAALQGKKRRTSREEAPHFEGKAPHFKGKRGGITYVNT